jgi:hypothetical protein
LSSIAINLKLGYLVLGRCCAKSNAQTKKQ